MRVFEVFCVLALPMLGANGDSDTGSEWWKTMSLYQIYPRSFKDSNGDGVGDLKGITSKLQHLVESKFDAFWLSPIYPSPLVDFGYDVSDFKAIDPVYGTMHDFDELLEEAHNRSLKVIMDLVPNHSSNKHDWFVKSVDKVEPYTDYYVWHEGKIVNGTRQPPNNWVSVFRGSAWTWNEKRQAYYLHQFAPEQPDLNHRNEKVVEEIKNVMRFWLDKGVDGFRIDAVPHLIEVEDLRDEPLTGNTDDPEDYGYVEHIYTTSQPETYEMVRQWRSVVDEYSGRGSDRIIVIESYASIPLTMKYYTYGAHFPFNFGLIESVTRQSSAQNLKDFVDNWMKHLPEGATTNWVAGNHDKPRLASRFGRDFAQAVTMLVQLMPGVAITYYGDEIGMEDTWLTWEETRDPQGCNAGKDKYEWTSRDPCRTPFQWDDSTAAGFSTNPKTWLRVNNNFKEVNLAKEKIADKSYYKSFLKLSELRQWPTVKNGTLQTKLLNKNVFAFSRELKGEKSLYAVINFEYQESTVDLTAFDNVPSRVQRYSTTDNSLLGEISSPQGLRIPARGAAVFIGTDTSAQ